MKQSQAAYTILKGAARRKLGRATGGQGTTSRTSGRPSTSKVRLQADLQHRQYSGTESFASFLFAWISPIRAFLYFPGGSRFRESRSLPYCAGSKRTLSATQMRKEED
jgi:hypothetical protein